MKNILRNTILSSLGSIKSIANGIHILNSHYIGRNDLPKEVFHDLLNKLSKKADFIRIEDAVDAIQNKTLQNQKLIAFTFDDGFEECYTKIAPVLTDFNTNAAFFINPGFIDGNENYIKHFTKNVVHINKQPMTWKMIKELHQKGFTIGSHTYDHVRLVGLNNMQLQKQITESKNRIEEQIESTCEYFAWTYGRNTDIDEEALNLVTKHHQYIFGGDNYTNYYSFDNRVINRRHIEGNWPIHHVNYFLSKPKTY
ncbi:MAG: polysaccharide deacetylase family protein [Flavobacteriales bacterium]|nr:polysaccharide deacetylase family protein [Flavobacteriales bacterium]MCB9365443.1 polysaccharide deacetylase family protein [Flavobacteriales bacterium]